MFRNYYALAYYNGVDAKNILFEYLEIFMLNVQIIVF
jgi:hypothetical protein